MRLIDADALKKIWCGDCENKHLCEDGIPACYDVQQLNALPTIEAEIHCDTESWKTTVTDLTPVEYAPVKHGRWVVEPDAKVMHCNDCNWVFEYYGGLEEEWNYCPNCGADMRGGEDG